MSDNDKGDKKTSYGEMIPPTPASIRKLWFEGARLRTLPLSLSPILLGVGAAAEFEQVNFLVALLALIVALALQIGVNYANDYSDGVRGSDANRVGPPRLTASGLVEPRQVKYTAFAFFGVAAISGLAITVLTQQWWFIAVGTLAILAAWFYTGGKHPYGYHGLGGLFVFIFFGPVAVLGTAYAQMLTVTTEAVLVAAAAGLFACAVLMVNNIRDIETDREAGKRTLAVILGQRWAKAVYYLELFVPFVLLFCLGLIVGYVVMFGFVALPFALFATILVHKPRSARDLITALQLTSITALIFAALVAFALSLLPGLLAL